MPTYRVTGPDGKVYRVTPPAGTNPTPDEVLARVRSEVERGTPAAAPSGPEDTPSFLRRLGQGYETGAQWLTRQLAKGIETAADTGLSPVSLGPFSETVAETVIPQTPLQAGIMAGTAAGGPLVSGAAKVGVPLAGTVSPWLARILGGTAGGAAGGAVGEEGALTGAALGAGTSALGEAGGAGANKLLRSLPGMKRAINLRDVRSVGETVGEIAPPLRGATTVGGVREMAAGGGLANLGQMKESAVRQIERVIGPTARFEMLSLGGSAMTLREANDRLSEIGARAFSRNPLDRTFQGIDQRQLYGEVARDIRRGIARAERGMAEGIEATAAGMTERAGRRALPPGGGQSVAGPARRFEAGTLPEVGAVIPRVPAVRETPREAVEATLEAAASPARQLTAPAATAPARPPLVFETAATTAREIPGPRPGARFVGRGETPAARAAGPARPSLALALWDQAQQTYARGTALSRLLGRPGLIDDNGMLRMEVLQRAVKDPRTMAWLRNKLGPGNFEKLAQTVTRGGGVGAVDKPAWGRGSMLDAARMLSEMKGGTGAVLGALPKTLLPNVGARYAGTPPFTRPRSLQTLLDLALERGALADR